MALTSTAEQKNSETLVREWESSALEVFRVWNEIGLMWSEWDRLHPDSTEAGSAEPSKLVYMRPATVNLVAIAGNAKDARTIETAVSTIPNYTPSRTLILVRRGRPASDEKFQVRIEVSEAMQEPRSAPIRTEIVTITASAGHDDILASVTSSLLMPDLPDVLFVPREPVEENPLVSTLLGRVDHVLVDTSSSRRPGAALDFLRETRTSAGNPPVGDLTWSRIQNWRQLIAQFFDPPGARDCLDELNKVEIVVAARNEHGRAGLTSGLLLAGWLASRLDWRVPGELVESEQGWKLTLRAGSKRKSREIPLSLREGESPSSCSSLVEVAMTSGGRHGGRFTVSRSHVEAISTSSVTTSASKFDRLVHSPCPDESTLLGEDLRLLREDLAFADALQVADELWPSELEADERG